MLRLSFIVLALASCAKPDDTATLRDEAVAVATYYRPAVDALHKRGLAIVERGGKLGVNLPGSDVATRQLTLAGSQLSELNNLVTPGADGKSAIEKQADAAAKDGKVAELQKLIDESTEKLDDGTRLVGQELNIAENWLLHAETLKAAAAANTPVPVTTDTGATGTASTPEAASGSGAAR
jgi:hypothetical protein